MAKFLMLMALWVLPALVSARPARTNLIVQGRVYCDTCRAGFETSASTYMHGARVRLECRERASGLMTYSAEGVTDRTGTYKIPVADDHENEICETVLLSSPQMECSTAVQGRERARVVLTRNNGIATNNRYANNLGFEKDAPIVGCGQLMKQYQEYDDRTDFWDSILVEDYGLNGYAIGRVRKDLLIKGENIVAGDVIIGLPSSGVHCSGFSLVTRVLAQSGLPLKDQLPGGSGKPIALGEALMVPTVIYVKQVLDIISKGGVKGIDHITDGGFMRSIPRVFENCRGLGATIYKDAWEVPAVFKLIQEEGRIEDAEMRRTFNVILVVSPDAAARILGEEHGDYSAYRIGQVTSGEGVTYQ